MAPCNGLLSERGEPVAKLGICVDNAAWYMKLAKYAKEAGLDHETIEMERSDWMDKVRPCSVLLWRPNLDPPYCEEGKEKIYFLETFLQKRVVPNWATFWHYDNKRAQAYFFEAAAIPTPRTWVSYSREDAIKAVGEMTFPVVSKTAGGAASTNVRLLRSAREALREIKEVFNVTRASKLLARFGVDFRRTPRTRNRYVLWQEYAPGNTRDLRVTVIGKRHVFAFWRLNRQGDFRASGSGSIDYAVENVERECLYCVELCRRYDFDSMAFDIVYKDGEFVVLEMSYAFNDEAIHNAPGHHIVNDAGGLTRAEGHTWPEELAIEYARLLLSDKTNVPQTV